MRMLLLIVVLLAMVLASGLGLTYSKHQNRLLYRQLEDLRARRLALELEQQQLLLAQSKQGALIKVDVKARALGMSVPLSTDVVYIKP